VAGYERRDVAGYETARGVAGHNTGAAWPGTRRRGEARHEMATRGRAGRRVENSWLFKTRTAYPVAPADEPRSAMATNWLAQGAASRNDRGGALRKVVAIAPLPRHIGSAP
jgi:hypothetical protein